jgi:heme exporter protein A
MQVVLAATGICKSFDHRQVLRGLDFSVCTHETVALLGANGSGKTTFLRILSTLLSPDEGKVLYFGQPLKGNEIEIHRRLGLVNHQVMLYSDLSAEENLHFTAQMYHLTDEKKRVDQMLEQVGLAHQRRQAVRTLSRGMQQRLAIARALLPDPQILLLDEPFTGLDKGMAERMLQLLQQIVEQPKTIVMTSHNLREVCSLAKRVLFLQNGDFVDEVQMAGQDEKQLADRYQTLMAAGG